MKLKKYKEIFEQDVTLKGYNSDEADDDLFGRPNYQNKDKEKSEKDEKNAEFGEHSGHYFGEENEEDLYAVSDGSDALDYDGDEEEEEDDDEEEEQERVHVSDDDVSPEDKDALDHLASLIRQMIKNAKIGDKYFVTTEGYDLSIQFVLNKTERFKTVMKVMGFLKKLSTDTLIQYDAELDLWETTDNNPLLTVDFYYNANKSTTIEIPPF